MGSPAPRVLVVDDDSAFRSMVCQLLADKGYDAVAAPNATEALTRATDGTFLAAIIDLVMPDMGGIELADKLKAQSPETEVVILTGHGDMGSAIAGIQHGVFDYLQKSSLDIARLERAVHEATGKSRLVRRNRALFQQTQESNRLLKGLHDIATELAGEAYLDRVLDKLVVAAKAIGRAACGRAVLFGRTHGEGLVIEVGAGDGAEPLRGARLAPEEGLSSLVLEQDAPVVLDTPRDHPRYSDRTDGMPTALPGLICAPLRRGRVLGTLTVAGRTRGAFGPEDGEALAILARQASVAIENAVEHERSLNFFTHTSEILVSFLEQLDVFYPGHSRGVAALADMVTRRLGLGEEARRHVHFGALLHDIGKVLVDPEILRSESTLTEEQRLRLRDHASAGVKLLQPISHWEAILPIIHSHHEWWDGRGYPRGLAREDIPLGARVVAVADAFDAMTRHTPHGARKTPEEALAELEACAGTQFDPKVVRLFVAEYRLRKDQIPQS
jgi:putative nucleotidyltransferase with HDIG domain